MRAAVLLLLAAGLASAEPPPAVQGDPLEAVRERVRTALRDLDRELKPLDDLTASYAGDAPAEGTLGRDALRAKATEAQTRLNEALAEFWPLWDVQRFTEGARLMGGLASGTEKPEAGAMFLDDTAIDDFKAEVKRTQDRAAAALENEEEAYKASQERRRGRLHDRLLAAGAGAAAAALAAGVLAWRRRAA